MARVISTGRSVHRGEESPVRQESRVLSCSTTFAAVNPNTFGYTTPVGKDIYLRSVRVWLFLLLGATAEVVQFKLRTGTERPGTLAEIQQWKQVLPIFVGDRESWWVAIDKAAVYTWILNEPYFGITRRFGVEVASLADVSGEILCSFEVVTIGR